MQELKRIIDCYDKTAHNYADKFKDELQKKHLDRILLNTFAKENFNKGRLIDLGCGPGQATEFLSECGFTDLIGIDISPAMISVAKNLNPKLNFEIGDILNLKYDDQSYGSAIAFYSIVHFDYLQLKTAFREIKKILVPDGELLFSFHIGNDIIHLDEFLYHKVNIDFNFFEIQKVTELVIEEGFEIIDIIERQPYQDLEYPSKRAYFWVKKTLQKAG